MCGADLNVASSRGSAFQPAVIGMRERRPIRDVARDRRGTATSIVVAVAGLLLIAGLGLSAYRLLIVAPRPLASNPPPLPSGPIPWTVQGVTIPDRARVDPTDVLPAVRRRIVEGNGDYKLLEITVVHARDGRVDLTSAGAEITYRYVCEERDPRSATNEPKRERVEFVLSEAAEPPRRSKIVAGDESVQEPVCVWSAAWRAAVASGFRPDSDFEAHYVKRPKSDKPSWIFTVPDKPELKRELDGMTCAIKVR